MTDSVEGEPVAGVSLLAVLVGAELFTGSVGVADEDSVDGACEAEEAASSFEHADKTATPSKTTEDIKNGYREIFISLSLHIVMRTKVPSRDTPH